MIAIIAFQLGSLFYTIDQPWFVPFDSNNTAFANTSAESLYNATTIENSEVPLPYAILLIDTVLHLYLSL